MLVVLLVFFVVLCTFNFNNSGKNGNGADTRLNLLEFLEGIRDDISDIRRELESWNLDIRPLEVQARLLQNKLNVLKLAKKPFSTNVRRTSKRSNTPGTRITGSSG